MLGYCICQNNYGFQSRKCRKNIEEKFKDCILCKLHNKQIIIKFILKKMTFQFKISFVGVAFMKITDTLGIILTTMSF